MPEDVEDEYEHQELAAQNHFPWLRILSGCAINILIPLVNGLCLGFGEIFAHEVCVAFGWREARVYDPTAAVRKQRRSWLWPI